MIQDNHRAPKCEQCGRQAVSWSHRWGCSPHYGMCRLALPASDAPLDPEAEAIAFLVHEGLTLEAATAIVGKA